MVVVSYSGKEINAKLVYYGAGLSGKTTNLEAIYEAVPDTSRGKMVSMKTQSDRTLFFDLLPLDLGEIMGFKTRFLLYTVPGQVFYNATRKLVLKGADALVFVADSEVGKMEENKESLANLRTNLAEYNINLDSIPWVLQYNKRDLPNVYTLDELNAELNPGKVPFFESVAREGKGVFETFRGISHLLMEKVTKDLRRAPTATQNRHAQSETALPAAEDLLATREQVRSSAPPLAPAQAIQREAASTPAPLPSGDDKLDYGREIELPGALSAAANRAHESQIASLPSGPSIISDPVAPSAPASAFPQPSPVSQPVATAVQAVAVPQNVAVHQPAPSAPEPQVPQSAPAAQRVNAAQPSTFVQVAPQGNAVADAAPTQLVVPVKLAPGGTYEIVLRIEVDKAA